MSTQKIAGVALIAMGLAFFSGIIPLPLTIITYPQYFWYQLHPDGASSTSPTLISPGSMTLSAKLVYYDATAGMELPSPVYWSTSVAILKNGATLQTVQLPYRDCQGSVNISGSLCAIGIFDAAWSVPTGTGDLYQFNWLANIKDSGGNSLGTQTKTTYAKTADVEPDGSFTINGQSVTQISSLIVTSPMLSFKFTPTKNSDKITAVKVEVIKGGVAASGSPATLTKQGDGSYTGTFTLPSYGVYEVRGNIEWSGSPLRKMSITASWGEEKSEGITLSWKQVIGAVSMLAGAFLVVRKEK